MLQYLLFNLMERIHHRITNNEIELIRNTHLFDKASEAEFNHIIHHIRLIKYPKKKLIFAEGNIGNALYVVLSGSVRVFTYNLAKQKMPLAGLNRGDYFGEQALISESNRTCNASVETTERTILIYIHKKFIYPLWKKDDKLRSYLMKVGIEQALRALASSTQIYGDLAKDIEQIEKLDIHEFQDQQLIFKEGDKADKVYVLLQGEVELLQKKLVWQKGHIFGELDVLENKPRSATLIAKGTTRLLAIDGSYLKELLEKNLGLKNLLLMLKRTYQLPVEGMVEQFIGATDKIGDAITTIYKNDDGRSIIALRSITENIFLMNVVNDNVGLKFKFKKDELNFVQLIVKENHIVGIEVYGEWNDLPHACSLLIQKETIDLSSLQHFTETGELITKNNDKDDEIICSCMSVKRSRLRALINKGIADSAQLIKETGVTTVCGICRYRLLDLLGESPWLEAEISLYKEHTNYIRSYSIKPLNTAFKDVIPGQHIILQVQVYGDWIERAYTISDKKNDSMQLTIKKRSKGTFTQWLFNELHDKINVKVTNPQGIFTLNMDLNSTALCFARGIGITPFLMFVKALVQQRLNKKLHILYSTRTKQDAVFKEEFQAAVNNIPSLSIDFHNDEDQGELLSQDVVNLIKKYPAEDIYICGTEKFENTITGAAKIIDFSKNRIHIERFLNVDTKQ